MMKELQGKQILDAINDPAMILDLTNRIVVVNNKMVAETGLPAQKFIGNFCHEVFHGRNSQPPGCPCRDFSKRLKTVTCRIEKERLGKLYEVTVSPIQDERGQLEAVLHVARDVTQQQQTKTALKKSEEKYRRLLDITLEGFWLLNTDLRIIEVNKALCTMLGYTEEELLGKQPYDLVDEENRNIFLSQCSKVPTSKHRSYEVSLRKKDGTSVHTMIKATTIANGTGTVQGSFCFLTDITEKKRLEDELAHSRKMEAVGTLAGGIAHDFNNILAAILGFAEIVKMEIPVGSRADKDIDNVIKAGKRAAELVRRILDFSRKNECCKIPVNMDSTVKEALKLIRATMPSSVEIKTVIGQGQNIIMADPTSMHQIILNLCTNAMHAMPNEKGAIKITLQRKRLSSRDIGERQGVTPGWFIVLSVQDNGVGMDDKTLERIFEPYFTTKGQGRGTGLGLAMIHGIVERSNGFIEVESMKGMGTGFHLYFPALEWRSGEETVGESGSNLPTGTENILVVDDEPSITEFIRTILRHLGYQVTAKTSSRAALQKFMQDPQAFDLVITDQTMPEFTGMELAQKMLSERADIPILLCTGYSAVLSEEETKAAGIRRFIAKPLSTKRIAEIVRETLDEE